MKVFSLKLTALALAGMMIAAPGAQAGGLYDDDDYNNPAHSNRNTLATYCQQYPDAVICNDDRGYEPQYEPRYERRHYQERRYHKPKRAYNGHCRAVIRAVGKRNLVRGFARNSARFAWKREVREVHGAQYADWRNARNFSIECTRHGALKSCVARGTPCRH